MRRWPKVALGDLLTQVYRPELVSPSESYRLLGVRLEGRGAFHRETVTGAETSATRLYRVEAGDFIYSRLFAWRGAFSIIESELDGCHVSNEFPIFRADPLRLNLRFLAYWFRISTVLKRVEADCSGSTPTTRNRYKEQFLNQLRIPLPSLTEQEDIVARLDALEARTRQITEHLDAAEGDALAHLSAFAKGRGLASKRGWRSAAIADIAFEDKYPEKVASTKTYPNVGILSYAKGLFGKAPIDGAVTSAQTLYRLRAGQFIYSRLFAFEGAYTLVPDLFDGYYVSNEFPTFTVNPENASAKYLMALFMTEDDWLEMRASTKGVGDRRLRIQPEQILARQIQLPPRHHIEVVDRLFDTLQLLRIEHTAIREANAALIPATLERLFTERD
jgi:type I restriction enzyme S subunit